VTDRPFPPKDIATRQPNITTVAAGTTIYRIYPASFGSIYFDAGTTGRLNAPDGAYGVLYAAAARDGAFAESLLRNVGRTALDDALLTVKGLVTIRATGALHLASLYGPGLTVLGATAEVTHSGVMSYDLSQAWSKALHDHPAKVDGIAYRSRHDDDEICYAIFERARGKLSVDAEQADLHQPWIWPLLTKYRVRFMT
jgi:hypothetical protein